MIRERGEGDREDVAMTLGEYRALRDSDVRPWPERTVDVSSLIAALRDEPDDAWRDKAACRGMTHMFFPEGSKRSTYGPARKICDGCPVREECAEAGADEVYGLWGGLSPNQRSAARVPRRFDPKIRDEAIGLVRAGMPDARIAARVGVHPRTVQKWRYAAGIRQDNHGRLIA